jgi:guanosine monophosphate reductase
LKGKEMNEQLTFNDVLIKPKFSTVKSRSEVSLFGRHIKEYITIENWSLPIMAANMDTVCSVEMAKAMMTYGGLSCLHRFWSIEENVEAYKAAERSWVSVGLGDIELKRAKALHEAGARRFILDVAHGAQTQVAERYVDLKMLEDNFVIVGNFATGESVWAFQDYLENDLGFKAGLDGVKVGVGPGSACTTRIKTGCGYPQLSAILNTRPAIPNGLLIADGGCRTPGDIAKALAAGADLVMLGGMLAGTDETPGEVIDGLKPDWSEKFKTYRGSASKESYDTQGKDQAYITAEGESFTVPYKGPVSEVLQDIEGGLRSAFSYVGAKNIKEFQEKAELVRVTNSGYLEGTAHGKKQ